MVFLYLEISLCFDKKILMLLQVIKIGLQLEKKLETISFVITSKKQNLSNRRKTELYVDHETKYY